jgi:hypothetical protein
MTERYHVPPPPPSRCATCGDLTAEGAGGLWRCDGCDQAPVFCTCRPRLTTEERRAIQPPARA